MALTKVTYSMIQGAPVNVFDYMTATQIANVEARLATLDTRKCNYSAQTI